jgi:hypothetical protein
MRLFGGLTAALACVAVVCGCGSALKPGVGSYCGQTGCATVTGQVERCGARGANCVALSFVSVSLLDSRGRPVTAYYAGTGHKLKHFILLVPESGRYILETTVGGRRVRRTVHLRVHHVLHADLLVSASPRRLS